MSGLKTIETDRLKDADKINNLPVDTTSQLSLKSDKTNVLELDNITIFTPTADYHPATKKYVDDTGGGGGAVDSVFSRTGIVVAVSGDYTASQVTNAFDVTSDSMDDITDGITYVKTTNDFTDTEKTLLSNQSGTNTGDQDLSDLVDKTNPQTIGGVKTFSSFPITPSSAPTSNYQVANKKYIDDAIIAAGAGDMLKSVYDPTNIAASAFDMDNMLEGTTNKILSSAERTILGNTSGTNTGDQDLSSYLLISTAASTYEPLKTADENYVTDAQLVVITNTSGTNTGDQDLSPYLLISSAASTYEPLKTADENYVTDAQLVVITNTSGTNTGDQDLSSYLLISTAASTYEPLKTADENYVTDAQLVVITNTSGTNTGDNTVCTSGTATTAATLATARAIYGNIFDGSAALTQIIASNYGGTGNGFTKFTGATTAEKTYTLPDANATILYSGGDAGTPSALVGTNISGTASNLISGAVTTITGLAPDTATTQAIQASITTCANLSTVGTITTGTWTGTTIAIANGGTGATSAANAINALLPAQGGKTGQFLSTNGTVASWEPAGAFSWGSSITGTSGTGATIAVGANYVPGSDAGLKITADNTQNTTSTLPLLDINTGTSSLSGSGLILPARINYNSDPVGLTPIAFEVNFDGSQTNPPIAFKVTGDTQGLLAEGKFGSCTKSIIDSDITRNFNEILELEASVFFTGATTYSENVDDVIFTRTSITANASASLTRAGNILTLKNAVTNAGGTLNDSTNCLRLEQDADSTGVVIDFINADTGTAPTGTTTRYIDVKLNGVAYRITALSVA